MSSTAATAATTKTPAGEAFPEQDSAVRSPAGRAPTGHAPARRTPVEGISAGQSPAGPDSARRGTAGLVSAEQALAGHAPGGQAAAGRTPAGGTVAERTPAGNAPPVRSGRRRGPADPVRLLMHRHEAMCARATHPLEIAAGLEAQGMTDRAAAADFRHRDVFSLAEELYARVPRVYEPEPVTAPVRSEPESRRAVREGAVQLLPGLCCLGGTAVLHTTAWNGAAVAAVSGAGTGAALWLCLRRGPLRVSAGRALWRGLSMCWLLAFLLVGGWAFREVLSAAGGSPGPRDGTPGPATLTALVLAFAPAAWCAAWFADRCRAWLKDSATLREFSAAVRAPARRASAAFLGTLLALLTAADLLEGRGIDPVHVAAAASLGLLLFISRLLAVHGRTAAAAAGPVAACLLQAGALAAVALSALPGYPRVLTEARIPGLLAAHPAAVQAVTCTAAALALVIHCRTALGRISGHRSSA